MKCFTRLRQMWRTSRSGASRLCWLFYGICFLVAHSGYALALHVDLQYGSRLIQYSVIIVDPVAFWWSLRRDLAGWDLAQALLVVGGAYWFAIGSGVGAIVRWRMKKSDRTRCPNCRYNLYANESGVCPECGHTVDTGQENETGKRTGQESGTDMPCRRPLD